jgi:hypothetical protein
VQQRRAQRTADEIEDAIEAGRAEAEQLMKVDREGRSRV